MRRIVRAKAAQHHALAARLLASGAALIVENRAKDPFWGRSPDWQGENWLGRLWMEVRHERGGSPTPVWAEVAPLLPRRRCVHGGSQGWSDLAAAITAGDQPPHGSRLAAGRAGPRAPLSRPTRTLRYNAYRAHHSS